MCSSNGTWLFGGVVAITALSMAGWGVGTVSTQVDGEGTGASLQELRGVTVKVEEVAAEVMRSGLTKQQVRAEVESRLRKAGIEVLTDGQRLQTPGKPSLRVAVHVFPGRSEDASCVGYAYCVEAQLIQSVRLDRTPEIVVRASTWRAGVLGGTVGRVAPDKIRGEITQSVDSFISAYLAANRNAPPARAPGGKTLGPP